MIASQKLLTRVLGVAAAMFAVGVALPEQAGAQSYPNGHIKFIANGSPGGVIDTIARVTASSLR